MTLVTQPLDIKAHLGEADSVVDALPWNTGRTPVQHRLARGRASALAHQIAGLLAGGWTLNEVQTALAEANGAVDAPDAAAQEKQWRAALNRAKTARRRASEAADRTTLA